MATGRIGVTPNLRTRWSKAPAGGTTSLSGLDDNSVSLVYDAGFEAVYRNGVLLSRGNDYTATNGTTITLIDATIAGDIIEVFANQAIPLTSTYTQAVADGKFINNTLVDAKGDIVTATAADTPARLAVGSNDQVLTADSTTSTGLKWATPAAGGMTLLNTGGTALTGSSVTISSIPTTYQHLQLIMRGFRPSTDGAYCKLRFNSDTNNRYTQNEYANLSGLDSVLTWAASKLVVSSSNDNGAGNGLTVMNFFDYANTSTWKLMEWLSIGNDLTTNTNGAYSGQLGAYNQTGAISSITLLLDSGTFSAGTVFLYGVK